MISGSRPAAARNSTDAIAPRTAEPPGRAIPGQRVSSMIADPAGRPLARTRVARAPGAPAFAARAFVVLALVVLVIGLLPGAGALAGGRWGAHAGRAGSPGRGCGRTRPRSARGAGQPPGAGRGGWRADAGPGRWPRTRSRPGARGPPTAAAAGPARAGSSGSRRRPGRTARRRTP